MFAIFKRELQSYFSSAIAYIVMAVFYFFSGLFFYVYCIKQNSSSLTYVFSSMFMFIIFIIPLITMKTFSDEKRLKTDQALLTSPVNLFEIVTGKYLAALTMFACCMSSFIVFAIVISFFATPQWSVIFCTFIGMLLLGGALIAIGMFFSALTSNQVVAAVWGIAAGLFIYFLDSIGSLFSLSAIDKVVSWLSFNQNYSNFTYGVMDLKNVVFFLSFIVLFNFFTIRVFEKKRWS